MGASKDANVTTKDAVDRALYGGYKGRMNLAPSYWGPSGWKLLHSVAMAYPENPSSEMRVRARQFLTSLAWMLPCERCRHHWGERVERLRDYDLRSNVHLQRWLWEMHNAVNLEHGKPEFSLEKLMQQSGIAAHDKRIAQMDADQARQVVAQSRDGVHRFLGTIVVAVLIVLVVFAAHRCAQTNTKV